MKKDYSWDEFSKLSWWAVFFFFFILIIKKIIDLKDKIKFNILSKEIKTIDEETAENIGAISFGVFILIIIVLLVILFVYVVNKVF
jgi:hypothetical protein